VAHLEQGAKKWTPVFHLNHASQFIRIDPEGLDRLVQTLGIDRGWGELVSHRLPLDHDDFEIESIHNHET